MGVLEGGDAGRRGEGTEIKVENCLIFLLLQTPQRIRGHLQCFRSEETSNGEQTSTTSDQSSIVLCEGGGFKGGYIPGNHKKQVKNKCCVPDLSLRGKKGKKKLKAWRDQQRRLKTV